MQCNKVKPKTTQKKIQPFKAIPQNQSFDSAAWKIWVATNAFYIDMNKMMD